MTNGEVAAVLLPVALVGLAVAWLGDRWLRRCGDRPAVRSLLSGYRNTALLYVAAKLGLPDLLSSGPKSSAELAAILGAHAPSLHRVLRGLVALRICSQGADGRFGLTRGGKRLRTGPGESLRSQAILTGEEYVAAWGGLLHSALSGEAAFSHVFGMSPWEHRRRHPALAACFQATLAAGTAQVAAAVIAAYDFGRCRCVADLGGGQGILLAAILNAYPSVRGILFDQPHVIGDARLALERAGVGGRCRLVGGDLLERIPEGADALLLKSVIHDWDDAQAVAILRQCRRSLDGQGRLLLIERLLPARVLDDPDAAFVDLHMLAVTGGRERSESEYRALMATAGFALQRVIAAGGCFHILEGLPVPG